MRKKLRLIYILLLINLSAGNLFSQDVEQTTITLSRIVNPVLGHSGKIREQVEIHPANNTVYYRKKPYRKFRKTEAPQNMYLFSDSVKLERIKQISKSIKQHSEECLYHNEYGYFRIEILNFCREDLVYGETFLINTPYECQDENDQVLVREYRDLITQLFLKKQSQKQ